MEKESSHGGSSRCSWGHHPAGRQTPESKGSSMAEPLRERRPGGPTTTFSSQGA